MASSFLTRRVPALGFCPSVARPYRNKLLDCLEEIVANARLYEDDAMQIASPFLHYVSQISEYEGPEEMEGSKTTFTGDAVTAACGLHRDNLRRLITWRAVIPVQAGAGRGRVRLRILR